MDREQINRKAAELQFETMKRELKMHGCPTVAKKLIIDEIEKEINLKTTHCKCKNCTCDKEV